MLCAGGLCSVVLVLFSVVLWCVGGALVLFSGGWWVGGGALVVSVVLVVSGAVLWCVGLLWVSPSGVARWCVLLCGALGGRLAFHVTLLPPWLLVFPCSRVPCYLLPCYLPLVSGAASPWLVCILCLLSGHVVLSLCGLSASATLRSPSTCLVRGCYWLLCGFCGVFTGGLVCAFLSVWPGLLCLLAICWGVACSSLWLLGPTLFVLLLVWACCGFGGLSGYSGCCGYAAYVAYCRWGRGGHLLAYSVCGAVLGAVLIATIAIAGPRFRSERVLGESNAKPLLDISTGLRTLRGLVTG